eukprot:scaffold30.g4445.t1
MFPVLAPAYAGAGALAGIGQALWRVASSGRHQEWSRTPAPQLLPHPLLNLVVCGDAGVGTSLALLYAGKLGGAGDVEPTAHADLVLVEVKAGGMAATLSIWHVGGRDAEMGPGFYSLANALALVYSPAAGAAAAVDSLAYWQRQAGSMAGRPTVVVASWRPDCDLDVQHDTVAAAERWCTGPGGGAPHYIVTLEDEAAVREAFGQVLLEALGRQGQAAEEVARANQPAAEGQAPLPAPASTSGSAEFHETQELSERMHSSLNPLYASSTATSGEEMLPPCPEDSAV